MKNWPYYSQNEINRVSKILKSGKVNYWTGNECKNFEEVFKKKFKINYSIAVSNGTVALEAALKVLNLKKDDEVIVSCKSYQSSASAIVNIGAKPVFCDVNFNTQNIDVKYLEKKISRKTKAIICVHLGGWPCEMDKLVDIAKKNSLKIIEDCSQAHGAKFNKKYVGSFGDIAVWSFCNDKIISTGGEGGMIGIKKKKIWKKIWSYKEIGKNLDKVVKNKNKKNMGFAWVHDFFGSNLRMTEMQAAIGIIQLKKLDTTLRLRNKINKLIWKKLKQYKSIIIPDLSENLELAPYRCYVKLNFNYIKKKYNLKKIIKLLNKDQIICNEGSCSEMYLEKSFKNIGFSPSKRLPNASKLTKISLAFFINPLIKKSELNKKINHISAVFNSISN